MNTSAAYVLCGVGWRGGPLGKGNDGEQRGHMNEAQARTRGAARSDLCSSAAPSHVSRVEDTETARRDTLEPRR